MKISILIVDDDKGITAMVEHLLQEEGYAVRTADTLFKAQGMVRKSPPDLIILDRQLPDGDGVDFCIQLRKDERTIKTPILFLTSKKSVVDRVLGLRVGGDDYLVKPFSNEEILARLKAILRRTMDTAQAEKVVLTGGPVRLDLDARRAYLNKEEIGLWPKEYELLSAFLRNPDRVLSREVLLDRVWGVDKGVELSTNVVDVTVGNLRKKLGSFGKAITAVRGVGFRLDV